MIDDEYKSPIPVNRFEAFTRQPAYDEYASFIIAEFQWITGFHSMPGNGMALHLIQHSAAYKLMPLEAAVYIALQLNIPLVEVN